MGKKHPFIKNCLSGGLSSVHGPKFFKSVGEKVLTHDDVNELNLVFLTPACAGADIELVENTFFENYTGVNR